MTKSIQERIAEIGITMKVRYGAPADPTFKDADGWTVTLKCNGHQMTLPFYQGRGYHGEEPKIEDVLDCLCMDAAGIENARNFEDWAGDYGYDADSRTAERIYKKTLRNRDNLVNLLGDAYNDFLWETERL